MKRNNNNEIIKLEVFSLIKRKIFSTHPHPVVDFLDPLQEYYERNVLEAILAASVISIDGGFFTSILLFGVKTTYKELVIREMQRYQMQEAAFLSFLDYNKRYVKNIFMEQGLSERVANRYIRMAYKIVKKRSLNPLFLNTRDAELRKGKSELWLKLRNPNYVPFSAQSVVSK